MIYEVKFFETLVDLMVACEKLGLPYEVRREHREVSKWFGKSEITVVYILTTINEIIVEEVDEHGEETNLSGRPSDCEEVVGEEVDGNESR